MNPIPLVQQDGLIDGKYRLGPEIGSGGVATVYRAVHVWTEREVAVKVLDPRVPHFKRLREAFLREARATVQLDHPNVVDVLDMGEDGWATAYMVMELLEGPTLRDVLVERGRLSEAETLAVLLPLIDALEKAHTLGIVHRDFKPENIMLVQEVGAAVTPKLLDFGVAEILRNARAQSIGNHNDIIMGTPQYMSPEQAQDQRNLVGPHTDVWGVGVVWYECLTGRAPFEGDTSMEVLEAVCTSPIDFDPLPEGYATILADALHRSTERRIGSLSELKRRIEERSLEQPSIPGPEHGVSAWALAPPAQTGVRRTLLGLGTEGAPSTPPPAPLVPPEMYVDSELMEVPLESHRKVALAGLGLALAVVLAAWWTVREPTDETPTIIEDAVAVEIQPDPLREPLPVPDPVAEAEPPVPIVESVAETEAVLEPEAEPVLEPGADPVVGAEPAESESVDAVPKPTPPRARRKLVVQREKSEEPPATPNPPEEPDYPKPPELVTEW